MRIACIHGSKEKQHVMSEMNDEVANHEDVKQLNCQFTRLAKKDEKAQ